MIGFVAMVLASANVVGGFVVTDRMLEMFKKREPPKGERPEWAPNGVNLLYLVTIGCFVLALRFLSSPATARRGNQIGAVGMVDRDRRDAAQGRRAHHVDDRRRALVGGAFGAVAARRVKMTAMPQMVALFNGVGGGAAALVALAEFH